MLYEDKDHVSVKDEEIGYDPSFFVDPNISVDNGKGMNILGQMKA